MGAYLSSYKKGFIDDSRLLISLGVPSCALSPDLAMLYPHLQVKEQNLRLFQRLLTSTILVVVNLAKEELVPDVFYTLPDKMRVKVRNSLEEGESVLDDKEEVEASLANTKNILINEEIEQLKRNDVIFMTRQSFAEIERELINERRIIEKAIDDEENKRKNKIIGASQLMMMNYDEERQAVADSKQTSKAITTTTYNYTEQTQTVTQTVTQTGQSTGTITQTSTPQQRRTVSGYPPTNANSTASPNVVATLNQPLRRKKLSDTTNTSSTAAGPPKRVVGAKKDITIRGPEGIMRSASQSKL
ncbi:MAG: hypothetical protein EZS28_005982 [Streblomastix strix]|uniref:Uncharacterized protein n=1 Tax=Streblomastix strix TaxID=222440 RepID=A0A5J4WV90_9EUKA|nr:MAG: hypothetical protein EZS28_005982 [Streblomastix strix]